MSIDVLLIETSWYPPSGADARGSSLTARAFGTPVKLFDLTDDLDANYQLPMFDVTRDGKQLVMIRRTLGGSPAQRWVLVQNWLTQSGARR